MKYLYKLNLILIIINIILFVEPFYALMFTIFVAIIQLILAIVIAFNFRKLSKVLKTIFIVYLLMALVIIALFYLVEYGYIVNGQIILNFSFMIAIGLAFVNLYMTYKTRKL